MYGKTIFCLFAQPVTLHISLDHSSVSFLFIYMLMPLKTFLISCLHSSNNAMVLIQILVSFLNLPASKSTGTSYQRPQFPLQSKLLFLVLPCLESPPGPPSRGPKRACRSSSTLRFLALIPSVGTSQRGALLTTLHLSRRHAAQAPVFASMSRDTPQD